MSADTTLSFETRSEKVHRRLHPRVSSITWWLALVLIGLGILVRIVDLKDAPLDFNPSRQLYSAIIARAMYYERLPDADPNVRDIAISHRNSLERLEPPFLESLVVATYLLVGEEQPWVARIYTISFWIVGASFLFALALRMMRGHGVSTYGPLVALAYILFLPLAIYASRSFQPDPSMVMGIIFFAWAIYQWSEEESWKKVIIAGISGGLTILIKGVAAFFIGSIAISIVLYTLVFSKKQENSIQMNWSRKLSLMLRNTQVWAMAALVLLPGFLYYFFGIGDNPSLLTRSILYRWEEVLTPSFFMRWLIILDNLLVLPIILIAFVSSLMAPSTARAMLLGMWVGYGLYGITFPKLIITHDYYQLPLIPIVALSLVPAASIVIDQIIARGRIAQLSLLLAGFISIAFPAWISRSVLVSEDFRDAGAYWQIVGDAIPVNQKIVGYTQDYGFRLMYYGWQKIDLLPREISSNEFENIAQGADYMVITAKNQMSENLKKHLENNYPIFTQGGGYVIYNLQP